MKQHISRRDVLHAALAVPLGALAAGCVRTPARSVRARSARRSRRGRHRHGHPVWTAQRRRSRRGRHRPGAGARALAERHRHRGLGPGSGQGRGAARRSLCRRPDVRQGPRRPSRPADALRLALVRAGTRRRTRALRGRTRARRPRVPRQEQHAGVRTHGLHRTAAARADAQSLESRLQPRRLLGRRRGARGRADRADCARHRRRRVDPRAGILLRPLRPEALARTDRAARPAHRAGGDRRGSCRLDQRPRQRTLARLHRAHGRGQGLRAGRRRRYAALAPPAHRARPRAAGGQSARSGGARRDPGHGPQVRGSRPPRRSRAPAPAQARTAGGIHAVLGVGRGADRRRPRAAPRTPAHRRRPRAVDARPARLLPRAARQLRCGGGDDPLHVGRVRFVSRTLRRAADARRERGSPFESASWRPTCRSRRISSVPPALSASRRSRTAPARPACRSRCTGRSRACRSAATSRRRRATSARCSNSPTNSKPPTPGPAGGRRPRPPETRRTRPRRTPVPDYACPAAALSASTSARSGFTRPAGIATSAASRRGSMATLSAPVTSHRIRLARSRIG
jgi:hypothetical protein